MTLRCLVLPAIALWLVGCEPAAEAPPESPAAEEGAPQTPAERADAAMRYEAIRGTEQDVTVLGLDGEETTVRFGTPEDEVLAALAPTLGAPMERPAYEECGAGPLTGAQWPNGFGLYFADGGLAGWEASGDDERIQTGSGVQLGSPLDMAQMTDPGLERMEDSTLGHEFALTPAGDGSSVGGFLSGDGPDATVTGLHAGVNCFAR